MPRHKRIVPRPGTDLPGLNNYKLLQDKEFILANEVRECTQFYSSLDFLFCRPDFLSTGAGGAFGGGADLPTGVAHFRAPCPALPMRSTPNWAGGNVSGGRMFGRLSWSKSAWHILRT